MTWKSWDANTRSKRALAIDRSLKAKKVYGDFNSDYSKSQNRSDVEDWDTVGTVRDVPHKPSPTPAPRVPREKPSKAEVYIPSSSEEKGLRAVFHKMNPIDQFKDLQTTRNVARTKKQVEAWKKNPKNGDIQGIDTQPKGYIENRIETTRSFLGVPIWEDNKINREKFSSETHVGNRFRVHKGTLAFQVPYGSGYIFYKKSAIKNAGRDINMVLGHELGHQFQLKQRRSFGSNFKIGFDDSKMSKLDMNLNLVNKVRRFNSEHGSIPYALTMEKQYNLKKGTGYDFYIKQAGNPLQRSFVNDMRYRFQDEEQFSEFFSTFITKKNTTKKHAGKAYNIFKKGQGRDLYKALKRADFTFLKGHIGGAKASSFKIF